MIVDMNAEPLVCDMSVFTPAERDRHVQNTRDLLTSLQAIHKTAEGCEFVFPNGSGSIARLAEFIVNEQLCCPFLEFTMKIGPADTPVSLTLTGPEGTREFLREEFSEVFS